jgi:glutaredoxin
VKEFLSRRGVPYTEHDISRDQQALEELSRLGYMTTPVTKINGDVVVGFDQKRLEALLR